MKAKRRKYRRREDVDLRARVNHGRSKVNQEAAVRLGYDETAAAADA